MPADETFSVPAPEKKWQLGFWSLIATQFQGAFNENALKFLVIYLILAIEEDKAQRDQMELLVGVLFAAPFILFSLVGGYFADRFSKRTVTIWTKVFEVGVMLFAAASLVGPNLNLALAAIFLVCTQGALFGPSKYGLLPELLPPEKLSWGNGVLELGTFLAIIVGSMSGSFLAEAFNGREIYAGALLLGFTVIGLVWHRARAGRGSREEIPSSLADRCLVPDEIDSQRSGVVAGGPRQHVFLLCRWPVAIQHFHLRAGRLAYPFHRGRLPPGGHCDRDRPRQFRRGLPLRRKN